MSTYAEDELVFFVNGKKVIYVIQHRTVIIVFAESIVRYGHFRPSSVTLRLL